MADPSKVKREPVEDGGVGRDSEKGEGGPTVLSAEAFTHGGIRKVKFEPKAPSRRQKKLIVPKGELGEVGEMQLPSEIMKLVKQSQEDANNARSRQRSDIKAPARVAFGFGSAMGGRAATISSRGGSQTSKKSSARDIRGSLHDDMHLDDESEKMKKVAVEPWDYSKYYPVTLPLRKPYCGTAEELDEEEFGESASTRVFDEEAVSSAEELHLMKESEEDRLLFFQIPSSLPLGKGVATMTNQSLESSSSTSKTEAIADHISLKDMPRGHLGKLLVYRSGAVKLRLGDVLFEVVPGSQCIFAQEVAAINPVTKHCCFLGEINQRAVLIPDVDDLLNSNTQVR